MKYTLRKNRRTKYMRLSVYPDGSVSVSVPWRMSQKAVERFLVSRATWIFEKLEYFMKHPAHTFIKGSDKEYKEYKEQARKIALERLEHWNQFYGFAWNKVSIRNQKTRWGSCSRQGNLSFNYKIATIAPELADYVIVHELCHLKEFNHSRKFWKLLEKTIPLYLEHRATLRANKM